MGAHVNAEGLAKQAGGLTPVAQSTLGLLLTWVISPLLLLDESEMGRKRSRECSAMLDEALASAGDTWRFTDLASRLARAEELQLDEEPEGPAAFRVDFLAALLYATRALLSDHSAQELSWCLSRVADTLDFASEQLGMLVDLRLDGAVMDLIRALPSEAESMAARVACLKQGLEPCRALVAAAVEREGRDSNTV